MHLSRSAGILLHPTSLPGPWGIGCAGEVARRFVDFLAEAGQSLWQILPLGPTGYGDSPYACFSAFAGNAYLLDLERLAAEGDLERGDLDDATAFPGDRVDFGAIFAHRTGVLPCAAARFRENASGERRDAFDRFCSENTDWLDDYALFRALKDVHGGAVWTAWPRPLAERQPDALAEARRELDEAVFARQYAQFQFHRQWDELKAYANERGVRIIGDIPIFVAFDSADVWAHSELFHLDEGLQPTVVAGVPPDYFSETGQLWGNPLYRWGVMAERGYAWWVARMRHTLRTVDVVRLDHFRGFAAYWEIPASEPTAVNGRWVEGPGDAVFEAMRRDLGDLPVIAEDLGIITPDVVALRDGLGLPGMLVLQFAFGGDVANAYLPHNHVTNAVVYTGTHDNDTTVGWYASREGEELAYVDRYLGPVGEPVERALIRAAYRSVADVAIVPLQDVLGLGTEARMNEPGSFGTNWGWRFEAGALTSEHAEALADLAATYGRATASEDATKPRN
jgi:4-alpha-glucanotransferase